MLSGYPRGEGRRWAAAAGPPHFRWPGCASSPHFLLIRFRGGLGWEEGRRAGGCGGGGHWPAVGALGAAAGTERSPRRFSPKHPRRSRLPPSVLLPGPAPPCPPWTSSCWRRRCRTAPRYLPPLRSPRPGVWRPGRPLEPRGGGRVRAGAGKGHPSGGAGEPEKAPRGQSVCVVTPFPE